MNELRDIEAKYLNSIIKLGNVICKYNLQFYGLRNEGQNFRDKSFTFRRINRL